MTDTPAYHFGEEWKRTAQCGKLRTGDDGNEVTLAGWVRKVREFGDLTFLDMWDRSGLVQLVVEVGDKELHTLFRSLR
ncbi:MAG: Asp-tRNA(Asn)/Glu-tRNA(Gln) amidotransferase GatCAB subunit C, partial [Candidatus Krumholzibacteria bacterium]|nr:Asp-tRNA(Asn)/Glu-tRNA(Gln) amidotransferase GatCAB subunit C [Candidatus Krumholzibacteria bacterium]